MLSPTSPIFSTLHDISSRALARHELSVSKALDKTEQLPRRMGDDNSGQYVYSSRLQSEVRQSKAMSSNLQNTLSHYQIQEGFLDSAMDRYSHMSMLAIKASDPLISELERARLNEEFDTIRKDLLNFSTEEVNGNDIFREAKKYELVNKEANLNWTDAKAEADARDQADPINDHYLATITSEYEQDVISFQIGQVGINAWLGGNDTAVEGEWRWTEGPEGLEGNGNGRLFWQGKSSGSAVGGAYENWGNNEPNNAGNEDYLQISQAVQPDGSVGKWNDLRNTNSSGATYQPRGYVLETDQGKLLGVMPQSNIQLENV
ncbi:MAG: lectin-like protein, partial [Verrucomicrobiota bacterium]|nr:lectin-like protein [Verrucomicrobiota bacterium]